jgi:hypothetical protein
MMKARKPPQVEMTANEMADRNEWACCAYSKEVSSMLRQQQAEIESLKMRELTMNPDILPTLEEWKLICEMVKGSEK